MATTKLPCGCKHDGHRWLVECTEPNGGHKAEQDARHQQALDEHRAQQRANKS